MEDSLCQGVTFAKGWSNGFESTGQGVGGRVKKDALAGEMGPCTITDSLQTTRTSTEPLGLSLSSVTQGSSRCSF